MRQEGDDKLAKDNTRDARHRRDHDDLNNERADRETGRQHRFLPNHNSARARREKRKREAERLSQLARLMQDPEYFKLYNETKDMLRGIELATERALADAIARKDQEGIDAIRLYQVDVLGGARNRLMDEDKPLSLSELRKLQDDVSTRMPEAVRKFVPGSEPDTAVAIHQSAEIEIPKL